MVFVYIGFILFIVALLALDLGVFHRKAHVIGVREALAWSAFWIGLGLAFSGVVYVGYEQHWFGLGMGFDAMEAPILGPDGTPIYNDGTSALVKYLTGFVIEKSLAVDNIFVIAVIFGALGVPAMYQHRVLFWGITGALVMRGTMIAIGAALIARFSWILYVFGGFLILTGIRMLLARESGEGKLEDNRIVRLVRRRVPISDRFHGQRFFVRAGSEASHAPPTPDAPAEVDRRVDAAKRGALLATPLLLALVFVEITDLIFAVDSIPAVFAITTDPFLVFTSNVFAILGLRSLYFALADMIGRFRYLKSALAVVLVVVGTKMLIHGWLKGLLGTSYHYYVLAVIALILGVGILASLRAPWHRSGIPGVRPAR